MAAATPFCEQCGAPRDIDRRGATEKPSAGRADRLPLCAAEGCTYTPLANSDLCSKHRIAAQRAAAATEPYTVRQPSSLTIKWRVLMTGGFYFGIVVGALLFAAPALILLPSTPVLASVTGIVGGVLTAIAMLVEPMPKMRCPHCRKKVKKNATTCSHCGARVR